MRRLALLPLAALLMTSPHARAEHLYGYVDDAGVAHFSNFASTPSHHRLTGDGAARPAERRAGRQAPHEIHAQVARIAVEHGLDPALVLAVVATESAFDPNARSPRGALGLMQLMPDTARRMGVSDPLDPEENLRGGVRYLSMLLDLFGDLTLALAAYNAGEGAVIRHGHSIPPYPETLAYVPKVLDRYADFQRRTSDGR